MLLTTLVREQSFFVQSPKEIKGIVINLEWFNNLNELEVKDTVKSLKHKNIKVLKACKCEPDGWMDGLQAYITEVKFIVRFNSFVISIILNGESMNERYLNLWEGDEFIVL